MQQETDRIPSPKADTVLADATPKAGYVVHKTRKGNWPLHLENRPGNKTVTIVENVGGDITLLLKLLKRHCGAGGSVRDETIELQGDQRARVEAFLQQAPMSPRK